MLFGNEGGKMLLMMVRAMNMFNVLVASGTSMDKLFVVLMRCKNLCCICVFDSVLGYNVLSNVVVVFFF